MVELSKLLVFGKRVISLCLENGISPKLYGSYLLSTLISEDIEVNDLDFYISEDQFSKLKELLTDTGLDFEYSAKYHTLQVISEELKIEFDSLDYWYDGPNDYAQFNFEGLSIQALSKKGLEHIYSKAASVSDQKEKNQKKLELLHTA